MISPKNTDKNPKLSNRYDFPKTHEFLYLNVTINPAIVAANGLIIETIEMMRSILFGGNTTVNTNWNAMAEDTINNKIL